jgi:hypothetical protein
MLATKRGFRGVSCSIWLDDNIWYVEIPPKMSNPRTCWREAEMCQIGREKAEFLREMHPKSLDGHV